MSGLVARWLISALAKGLPPKPSWSMAWHPVWFHNFGQIILHLFAHRLY
jgi:hypothetical protein